MMIIVMMIKLETR